MKTSLSNLYVSLVSVLAAAILCSCHSERNSSDSVSETITEIGIVEDEDFSNGLSLAVSVSKGVDDPNNDYIKYSVSETNDSILILPSSGNFKDYSSVGELEFHPERDIYCSDYIENPQLYVNVTNNSDETVSIDKLRVNVASSILDTFPYVYMEQMFFHRCSVEILNECWANWGTMTIEYNFERKNRHFNGKYDHVLKIPYFEDRIIIDFTEDLIKDGYNPQKLEGYLHYIDNVDLRPLPKIYGHNAKASNIRYAEFDSSLELSPEEISRLAYPFTYERWMNYFVSTRIHARISFSNSKFTKRITGTIPLTCSQAGGAEDEIADKFDIQLKPVGKDYYYDLPYVVTLRPGQSERIQVGIKCEKSSHHYMTFQLMEQDAVKLQSKPIHFYNVNGRHSVYHILKSWNE